MSCTAYVAANTVTTTVGPGCAGADVVWVGSEGRVGYGVVSSLTLTSNVDQPWAPFGPVAMTRQ